MKGKKKTTHHPYGVNGEYTASWTPQMCRHRTPKWGQLTWRKIAHWGLKQKRCCCLQIYFCVFQTMHISGKLQFWGENFTESPGLAVSPWCNSFLSIWQSLKSDLSNSVWNFYFYWGWGGYNQQQISWYPSYSPLCGWCCSATGSSHIATKKHLSLETSFKDHIARLQYRLA